MSHQLTLLPCGFGHKSNAMINSLFGIPSDFTINQHSPVIKKRGHGAFINRNGPPHQAKKRTSRTHSETDLFKKRRMILLPVCRNISSVSLDVLAIFSFPTNHLGIDCWISLFFFMRSILTVADREISLIRIFHPCDERYKPLACCCNYNNVNRISASLSLSEMSVHP